MLRDISEEEISSFQSPLFVALPNIVSLESWPALQKEAKALAAVAKPLTPNPHSSYDQVNPSELVKNPALAPRLLELYHSQAMKDMIQKITGWKQVLTLPLTSDGRFEINCKTNVYSSAKQSYLGWHFDRTFNYRGEQVVTVLTLENSGEGENLEVLPMDSWSTRKVHLAANSMSIHVPDKIFHRVLQLKPMRDGSEARRIVFVMRFTNDATPVPYSLALHAKFLLTHPLRFAIVGDVKWIAIIAILLSLLLLASKAALKALD